MVRNLIALCGYLQENGFGHAREVGPVALTADVRSIRGEKQARLAWLDHNLGGVVVGQGDQPQSLEDDNPSAASGISIDTSGPCLWQVRNRNRASLLVEGCNMILAVVSSREYVIGDVGDVPQVCGMASHDARLRRGDKGGVELPALEARLAIGGTDHGHVQLGREHWSLRSQKEGKVEQTGASHLGDAAAGIRFRGGLTTQTMADGNVD